MLERQRSIVHGIGEERAAVARLGEREAPRESDRSRRSRLLAAVDDTPVGAYQHHFDCAITEAGERQDVGEPDAGPGGIADGAALPLQAFLGRLVEDAAIAGALHHRWQGDRRQAFQLTKAQLERLGDGAPDTKLPGRRVDSRRGKVVADVEVVDRRQPVGKRRERIFEIERRFLPDDETGLFWTTHGAFPLLRRLGPPIVSVSRSSCLGEAELGKRGQRSHDALLWSAARPIASKTKKLRAAARSR